MRVTVGYAAWDHPGMPINRRIAIHCPAATRDAGTLASAGEELFAQGRPQAEVAQELGVPHRNQANAPIPAIGIQKQAGVSGSTSNRRRAKHASLRPGLPCARSPVSQSVELRKSRFYDPTARSSPNTEAPFDP
jgi:hypothetical protein